MYNTNDKTKLLSEEIAKIGRKNKNNHIWIGGDFNLPDIDWSNNNSIVTHQYSKDLNEQFLETFENSSLLQVVDFHTRKNYTCSHVYQPPHLPIQMYSSTWIWYHNTAALIHLYCHPQCHRPTQRKVFCWNRTDFSALWGRSVVIFARNQQTTLQLTSFGVKLRTLLNNARNAMYPQSQRPNDSANPGLTKPAKEQ